MSDVWWETDWELPFKRIKYFSYYYLGTLETYHIHAKVFEQRVQWYAV